MWFDVIKMFVTIAQHKKETDIEQRERVSKLYLQMSELLADAAKDLSQDVYPQGKCATMWALAENLLDYLKDKVNSEDLNMISGLLEHSSKLELEYAKRKEPEAIKCLFDAGTLDMTQQARKYYMTERDKAMNKVSWIHNLDLKNQSILRGMSNQSARRDLLKNNSLI